MALLNDKEINVIATQYGCTQVSNWSLKDFSDNIIGYLGDHLNLTIQIQVDGVKSEKKLFVKCMPRLDKLKADYIDEIGFFKKEFVMLNDLFKKFQENPGARQWRPKLVYIKKDLFVFEDVSLNGYEMPSHLYTMAYDELSATVRSLARFHAQSIIFEEQRSKEIGKTYRIWDDYKEFLQESTKGQDWRDTGIMAVIDFLKHYSNYKSEIDFNKKVENIIPIIFDHALDLMKPNFGFRNVVVHRDIWTNNILLKSQDDGTFHALIIDFQTVLYCSPMMDLSSIIYFNTTKLFRKKYTRRLIDIYYETLSEELSFSEINIKEIYDKQTLINSYETCTTFGITQATLIVPIVAMTSAKRKEIFSDPETAQRANRITRSNEFINIAKEDKRYHDRVLELFDEFVEKYIYPNNKHFIQYS